MSAGFAGKIAVVTGAARGVGACAATLLTGAGARVVAADLRGEELRARFPETDAVATLAGDLGRSDECERVVAFARDRFGGLDLVFANAGATTRAPLNETTDDLWSAMLEANLASVFRLFRAAVPALIERGGGSLVANASINALKGNHELAAYAAAKTGVIGLTRALALELAAHAIRVNAVCPGTLDTPMTEDYLADAPDPAALRATLIAKHPLGRLGRADDVARAALFLLSDEASFITGVALPVDGGRHVA